MSETIFADGNLIVTASVGNEILIDVCGSRRVLQFTMDSGSFAGLNRKQVQKLILRLMSWYGEDRQIGDVI